MQAYLNSSPSLTLAALNIDDLPQQGMGHLRALRHLDVSGNQLQKLPGLPPNLETLQASSNALTIIEMSLPETLTFIGLDNNKLRWFRDESPNNLILPGKLHTLSLRGNLLQYLPRLPPSLHVLIADHNELLQIPNLPSNLAYFSASHNQLTVLKKLPESLHDLDISHNQLCDLPQSFANSLRHGIVEISNNPWSNRARKTIASMSPDTIVIDISPNWIPKDDFRGPRVTAYQHPSSPPSPSSYRPASSLSNFFRKVRVSEIVPPGQIISIWEQCHDEDQKRIRSIAGARIRNAIRANATFLDLKDLGLTSLPNCLYGIQSLKLLEVEGNFLKQLPDLPPKLVTLVASRNRLKALPHLPDTIETVWARGNLLTELRQLPNSLQELVVDHNRLTYLPALPAGTNRISVAHNALRTFPHIQCAEPSVNINIRHNRISEITFAQFPQGIMGYVEVTGNPFTVAGYTRLAAMPPAILVVDGDSRPNSETGRRSEFEPYRPPPGIWRVEGYESPTAEQSWDSRRRPSTPMHPYDPLANDITMITFAEEQERLDAIIEVTFLVPTARWLHPSPPAPTVSSQQDPDYKECNRFSVTSKIDFALGTFTPGYRTPEEIAMRDSIIPWLVDTTYFMKIVRWVECAGEENAQIFVKFLNRLTETREYQLPAYKDMLKKRVNDLIIHMLSNDGCRELCFSMAREATLSCGDRVTLTLNDMEMAHINFKAERGYYKMDELFDLGEGMFKLSILDEIAAEHVMLIRNMYPLIDAVDEIEVRLGYQTLLAKKLSLPGVAQAMLYASCAGISPKAQEWAQIRVEHHVARSGSLEFMSRWLPWQLALKRKYPEKYAVVQQEINQRREGLAWAPKLANDQTYLQELAELSHFEVEQIAILTTEVTSDYLKQRVT